MALEPFVLQTLATTIATPTNARDSHTLMYDKPIH